jgi:hypothetical protein
MIYRISATFGPQSNTWNDYIEWAGLQDCQAYYSIDGIMRTRLFIPESPEDWQNCVNADFNIYLITNLEYAQKILSRYSEAEILGVIENPKLSPEIIPPDHILMGYDILDEYNEISLLTNWGGKMEGIQNLNLNRYALFDDLEYAYELKEMLHRDFPQDDHAKGCEVWSVYKIRS